MKFRPCRKWGLHVAVIRLVIHIELSRRSSWRFVEVVL